jgi:hypothetical protein
MTRNLAATRPVNPPNVEPKITIEQLWAGLGKKARDPKDYILDVASVSISEDSKDKVWQIVPPCSFSSTDHL